MNKKPFGRRINNWLAEPKGEIFRDGKWRFWFPTLLGLTALNAVMTAMIFGQDGAQKYIGHSTRNLAGWSGNRAGGDPEHRAGADAVLRLGRTRQAGRKSSRRGGRSG